MISAGESCGEQRRPIEGMQRIRSGITFWHQFARGLGADFEAGNQGDEPEFRAHSELKATNRASHSATDGKPAEDGWRRIVRMALQFGYQLEKLLPCKSRMGELIQAGNNSDSQDRAGAQAAPDGNLSAQFHRKP